MADAYSTRFDQAVSLAVSAFRPVFRKKTDVPYITHLFAVTALVGEYGGDEDQLCAAILHDYLEDIEDADEGALRAQFGDHVVDMVHALSDTVEFPKPPWRPCKEAYIAQLAGKSPDVKLVSAADKLHNCRSIRRDVNREGVRTHERFSGKRDGTLWYYREVARALGEGWTHPLLDALTAEVEALHADTERMSQA
jgi:(p)ppGpp synthase/HD superfamily hydrolase